MNHQRVGPKEKIKRGQIKLTEALHDLHILAVLCEQRRVRMTKRVKSHAFRGRFSMFLL